MANKDVDVLSRFATANDAAIGYINRVDTATSKFRKSKRKGSIAKAAMNNLFEFPVFVSNTIPLDYATATVSLLEQIYASYLQMGISQNPVVDASTVKRGLQFADYKTNTNKYLEYVDTFYQQDACHAEYVNEDCKVEFDLLSIEDKEAKVINEAYDYEPLSEFDHFFQEAQVNPGDMMNRLYPIPDVNQYGIVTGQDNDGNEYNLITDPANVQYGTVHDIRAILQNQGMSLNQIDAAVDNLNNTMRFYHLPNITTYDVANNTSRSDTNDIGRIQGLCAMMTPAEFAALPQHDAILDQIRDLDRRNPGFEAAMNVTMRHVQQARLAAAAQESRQDAQADTFRAQAAASRASEKHYNASADKTNRDMANIPNAPSYDDSVAAQRRYNVASANKAERDMADMPSHSSYDDYVGAQRDYQVAMAEIAKRNAEIANSRFHQAVDAVTKTGQAVGAWTSAANQAASAVNTGINAYGNIKTLPDQIKSKKAEAEIKRYQADHMEEDNRRKWTDVYSRTKTSNMQYVRDADCQKLNTMKPLLMRVTLNMLNKDDSLQPIEYIIGVKCHTRMVKASILPEVAKYPLKEMDKISRKVKWRAGELKFLKDIVFRIKEKKQTAADSRDPNRKWYRRLYELAHMKGDAPAAAVVEGKSLFKVFIKDKQGKGSLQNGLIPNASIIMSQADVDNIKAETEIDLLKASAARKFCGELFLLTLIIVDTDRESIKIMVPDLNNDYDVHSLAAVNKQLATLDTMGTKTRDMFKILGA